MKHFPSAVYWKTREAALPRRRRLGYLARHGSTRSWHGTARDIPVRRCNLVLSFPEGKELFDRFWIFMALLEVKGVVEMIVSHRAPSSFSMSSYRVIWTHLRSNSVIFINLILQKLLT